MKKLGKISINPERIMKNEELVNLKGGYDVGCYCVFDNGVKLFARPFDGEPNECNSFCVNGWGAIYGIWESD